MEIAPQGTPCHGTSMSLWTYIRVNIQMWCRPLPEELLEYAQTDVHYLCYLAGQLWAQLASRGPDCPQEASRRSHEMCLALYSKPGSEVTPTWPVVLDIHGPTPTECMHCLSHLCVIERLTHTAEVLGGAGSMVISHSACDVMQSRCRRYLRVSEAPFNAPYCMQAAANAATMAALRRANASAAQAHPQKDTCISRMADCMHALCCWRDKRARRVDEGNTPVRAAVPMLHLQTTGSCKSAQTISEIRQRGMQ